MSAARRGRGESGVAALELALFFPVLAALVLLGAPLIFAMTDQTDLQRAAGRAARFATMVPDRAHPGLAAGTRRPTDAEVADEARAAYDGHGVLASPAVTQSTADRCPRRRATTVHLESRLDLGPFASLYRLVGLAPGGVLTLSATTTSCQE